jgi:hypothetical protein
VTGKLVVSYLSLFQEQKRGNILKKKRLTAKAQSAEDGKGANEMSLGVWSKEPSCAYPKAGESINVC